MSTNIGRDAGFDHQVLLLSFKIENGLQCCWTCTYWLLANKCKPITTANISEKVWAWKKIAGKICVLFERLNSPQFALIVQKLYSVRMLGGASPPEWVRKAWGSFLYSSKKRRLMRGSWKTMLLGDKTSNKICIAVECNGNRKNISCHLLSLFFVTLYMHGSKWRSRHCLHEYKTLIREFLRPAPPFKLSPFRYHPVWTSALGCEDQEGTFNFTKAQTLRGAIGSKNGGTARRRNCMTCS